jgi:hypothetical protein
LGGSGHAALQHELNRILQEYPQDAPHWSLLDAFDGATNGIENPESFALMEEIREAPLQAWKHLIYAIQALYQKDVPGCKRALEALDASSPPGALKPLFSLWIRQSEGRPPAKAHPKRDGPALDLYRRLLIQPHPLCLLAQQAEEALRQGMDSYFTAQTCRILKRLQVLPQAKGPLLALRYARYCLNLLRQYGFERSGFPSAMIKTIGEADGYCAIGFTSMESDAAAASQALQRALAAGDGRFLDGQTAALIAQAIPLLGERKKQRPPRRVRRPGQLDLFEGPASASW